MRIENEEGIPFASNRHQVLEEIEITNANSFEKNIYTYRYIYRKDTSNGKLLKRGGQLIVVDCFGQIHEVIYEKAKLSLASLERKRYRQ